MLKRNLLSKKGMVVLAMVLFFGAISFGTISTAIAGPVCEGDFDTDGDVDGSDLALFAGDFGRTDCDSSGLYYTKAEVDSLVADLQGQIDDLKALLAGVSRAGDDITFERVNVHIVNGNGYTDSFTNGLGNLIVGYNESYGTGDDRTGSHNIVVGRYLNYSSYGGLVVGYGNEISGEYASVSGGIGNTASGDHSSVSGGRINTASGYISSISGGNINTASDQYSSVSGGEYNTASDYGSSVSGGRYNVASGGFSFVGGGGGSSPSDGNTAFAKYSSVLGGWRNIAGDPDLEDHDIGAQSVISAGSNNVASGDRSAVSGGYNNIASAAGASVSGGRLNTASALGASVSGGDNTSVADNFDWAAGDLYEAD